MRLLLISNAALGKGGAESLQTSKYIKYLLKSGVKITHITTPYSSNLDSTYDHLKKEVKMKFSQKMNPYVFRFLRRFFPDKVKLPDEHYLLIEDIEKLAAGENYDVIYSRSTPFSSAIAAKKLKMATGKPWVLHISDPWADSSYLDLKNGSKKVEEYHRHHEKKSFEIADLITVTSEKTREFYIKKYPKCASKIEVSLNVFDFELFKPQEPVSKPDGIQLLHSGNFYTKRSPAPLLRVCKKNEDWITEINIQFLGKIDDSVQSEITKIGFSNIEYLGSHSHQEAQNIAQGADVLLCIDIEADSETDLCYFPSKLLDYLILNKMIFIIWNRGSEIWNFATSHGFILADIKDEASIKDALKKVSELDVSSHPNISLSESPYSAKNAVSKLLTLLNHVVS